MAMIRKDFHPENYEYLNGKPVEHTEEEKRKNWWYYHKWSIAIAIAVVIAVLDILRIVFGIGETSPDYEIAYVGMDRLPDDTAAQLEEFFCSIGEDMNGDGKVTVQINQYTLDTEDDTESSEADSEVDSTTQFYLDYAASDSASYRYAATIQIIGDLEEYESFLFLMEDPESFEEAFGGLSYLDGSLPAEDAEDIENMYISWTDSPLLSSFTLGEYETTILDTTITGSSDELLSGLYLGRRGFWNNKSCKNADGCEALWNRIVEGVIHK